MLIEAARRADAAAKEMLALVNEGAASSSEMREALAISKSFMAVGSAFQASAAKVIAQGERHGDGGAEVLAEAAGLSRREAHSHMKTARVIEAVPAVRDAVEEGRVPVANAKRLAEAVQKTSAEDVQRDADLLIKAESMRPEQFAKEARRWATERQGDGGEGDYRRRRARRCVRIWDADDGMVRLHGEFDAVAGKRIANRMRAEARRLHKLDKRDTSANSGGRRSFDQCMADALDHLTAGAGSPAGGPVADIALVAHVDKDTGRLIGELPSGERLPAAVLEELFCCAEVTPVIYDTKGRPIWCGHTKRTANKAQFKALIARYGGCFACGADPATCQPHHIDPWARHGRTDINNLVPACWDCHDKIHIHGWQIHIQDGQHTLRPPERINYGPAHAPDHPLPLFTPDTNHAPNPPPRGRTGGAHVPDLPSLERSGAHVPDPPLTNGSDIAAGSADVGGPLARPGPATARAALRNARAQRDGPRTSDTERSGAAAPGPAPALPVCGQDESLPGPN